MCTWKMSPMHDTREFVWCSSTLSDVFQVPKKYRWKNSGKIFSKFSVNLQIFIPETNFRFHFPLNTNFKKPVTRLLFRTSLDRMRVYARKQEPAVHYFIRTELNGQRYYVVCYTYTERFYATMKNSERSCFKLLPEKPDDEFDSSQSSNASASDERAKDDKSVECFVPRCIVAVSSQTYFETIKSCLTLLANQLERPDADFKISLEKAAFQLFCTCIPPDGNY